MYVVNGIFGVGLLLVLLRRKQLGIYPLFLALYCLIYILVPALAASGSFDAYVAGGFVKVMAHFKELEDYISYANWVVFLGLVVIAVIAFYKPSQRVRTGLIKKDVLYKASLWGVGIATASFGIIVLAEGGVYRLFAIAELLRAGEMQIKTGFLLHFAKLVLPASIILFASILEGYSSRYLLWFSSFVLSMMVLYILAGRANFAIYFISYVYLFILKRKEVKIRYVVAAAFFGLLFVQYGEAAFSLFIYEGTFSRRSQLIFQGGLAFVLFDTLTEFVFPYTNIMEAIDRVESIKDLYVLELPKAIVNILPAGTFGVPTLNTLSDYNTLIYGTEGEMPVDLVSFGYYSLHLFGVVAVISLYALLFRTIDVRMGKYEGYLQLSLHSVLACKLPFIAMYADAHQVIDGNLYLIVFVLLLAWVKRFA
jgi:hypothetical protein